MCDFVTALKKFYLFLVSFNLRISLTPLKFVMIFTAVLLATPQSFTLLEKQYVDFRIEWHFSVWSKQQRSDKFQLMGIIFHSFTNRINFKQNICAMHILSMCVIIKLYGKLICTVTILGYHAPNQTHHVTKSSCITAIQGKLKRLTLWTVSHLLPQITIIHNINQTCILDLHYNDYLIRLGPVIIAIRMLR